jgi:hypothetical protein
MPCRCAVLAGSKQRLPGEVVHQFRPATSRIREAGHHVNAACGHRKEVSDSRRSDSRRNATAYLLGVVDFENAPPTGHIEPTSERRVRPLRSFARIGAALSLCARSLERFHQSDPSPAELAEDD